MEAVFSLILGLVFGSFADCLAFRVEQGYGLRGFLFGRSFCDRCRHELRFFELIPVVSFVLQKGKCNYCKESIGRRHIVIEIFSGLIVLLFYMKFGFGYEFFMYIFFCFILLVLSLVDLKTGYVLDNLIVLGVVNYVFWSIVFKVDFLRGFFVGFVVAGFIFLISKILGMILKRESMGFGDIELYFMTSIYFSLWECFVLVMLSCIFGIVFAVLFPKIRVTYDYKDDFENGKLCKFKNDEDGEGDASQFPFAPFISMAALVSLFFAKEVVEFYFMCVL